MSPPRANPLLMLELYGRAVATSENSVSYVIGLCAKHNGIENKGLVMLVYNQVGIMPSTPNLTV